MSSRKTDSIAKRERRERAEDDLAFGDEAPAMADEVALADAEIGGDARIVGVRDALDGSHGAGA